MHQKYSASLSRLFLASKYSISGLSFAWNEGAFRLECYLFTLAILLAVLLSLNWWQLLIIFCSWLFLLIIEILNSAIEAVVDRVSLEKHTLSKIAKDLASAAVFLSSVFTGVINISMFGIHFLTN
jgi:diacylglycerol kinase (ATP)